MGVTYIQARLRRPDGRGPTRTVRFLVDSGAIYSVLPAKIWRALRLRAERKVEFTLADGTPIERGVSECRFEIQGKAATSPVVLGAERDGALLGAVTLETLGLMLNPLTREILPMRMPYPYRQLQVARKKESTSIYTTLWTLQFPKHEDTYIGREWIEVTPTPGCGYEDGTTEKMKGTNSSSNAFSIQKLL